MPFVARIISRFQICKLMVIFYVVKKVVYKDGYLIICKDNDKIVRYNFILNKEDSRFVRQICVLEKYKKTELGIN